MSNKLKDFLINITFDAEAKTRSDEEMDAMINEKQEIFNDSPLTQPHQQNGGNDYANYYHSSYYCHQSHHVVHADQYFYHQYV